MNFWHTLSFLFMSLPVVQDDSPGGGGGVLWYFHTYVGSAYFFGFKILSFNIFGGFQKKGIFFGGMKILWIFFWGHHKIGLV